MNLDEKIKIINKNIRYNKLIILSTIASELLVANQALTNCNDSLLHVILVFIYASFATGRINDVELLKSRLNELINMKKREEILKEFERQEDDEHHLTLK